MALSAHLPRTDYELAYDVTISEQEALRIYFNKTAQCIITQSVGFVYGQELHMFLDEIIILLGQKKTSKLIVDLTYRETYTDEDQTWIDTDWFPRALKAGLIHFGYVMPKDLFMQLSADEILVKRKGSVQIAPFGELEKAVNWIKKQ